MDEDDSPELIEYLRHEAWVLAKRLEDAREGDGSGGGRRAAETQEIL